MYTFPTIRTVEVLRYIAPLREGGSLPAIAEADDEFKYVLKFSGAGQGVKALIAELIGWHIAKALEIPIPELVFANIEEGFGRAEPDEEIQDLLKASRGLNLGLHFLSQALTFDPAIFTVDPKLASKIVWLDAFLMNVDRTSRNTNMLIWRKELWLIDNGASLYFHHTWDNWKEQSEKPFIQIKDHVLLPEATELAATNTVAKQILTDDLLQAITNTIPEDWLQWPDVESPAQELRDIYFQFLQNRLIHSDNFLKAATDARK
jgi:hypothetical protein